MPHPIDELMPPWHWAPNGRCASSALTHSDATDSRASLARMEAAEAVHTNGRGSAFRSVRHSLMAACRLTMEWKLPRRMRCLVMAEKNVSTAFSQEPEVGGKWNVQRGCRASQAFTLGCV